MFYVGKGSGRRAWDFAPGRRTPHHVNIVRKHGRKNIVVAVIPQPDEDAAFAHEADLIAAYRASGVTLLNLTDGGEGCAGRPMPASVQAAFAKGRLTWAERGLSEEATAAIRAGVKKGRSNAAAWRQSEAGQAHVRTLHLASVAELEARVPHEVVCGSCGTAFMSKHPRATYCSRPCGVRAWRERHRDPDRDTRALVPYSTSTTGVRGVYATKHGTWTAMIGVAGKLLYLGSFETKGAAAEARLDAEKQHGRPSRGGRPRTHRCG